jgi:hypothetical protein
MNLWNTDESSEVKGRELREKDQGGKRWQRTKLQEIKSAERSKHYKLP